MTPAEWDARLVELEMELERMVKIDAATRGDITTDFTQRAIAAQNLSAARTALLTHARSRVEGSEMREALEPLARAATTYERRRRDEQADTRLVEVELGLLRAARRALSAPTPEQPKEVEG